MMLQIFGLIFLSVISFVIFGLLLGIHTMKKCWDTILFSAGVLMLFISVNALYFAGWIAIFNISKLHTLHTFRSSFQTVYFAFYLGAVMLFLLKPLSILMEKAVNFINGLQWRLEDKCNRDS